MPLDRATPARRSGPCRARHRAPSNAAISCVAYQDSSKPSASSTTSWAPASPRSALVDRRRAAQHRLLGLRVVDVHRSDLHSAAPVRQPDDAPVQIVAHVDSVDPARPPRSRRAAAPPTDRPSSRRNEARAASSIAAYSSSSMSSSTYHSRRPGGHRERGQRLRAQRAGVLQRAQARGRRRHVHPHYSADPLMPTARRWTCHPRGAARPLRRSAAATRTAGATASPRWIARSRAPRFACSGP